MSHPAGSCRSAPALGYRRLLVLLRRESVIDNHKRVYRLYWAESLQERQRRRRELKLVRDVHQCAAQGPTNVGDWTSCMTVWSVTGRCTCEQCATTIPNRNSESRSITHFPAPSDPGDRPTRATCYLRPYSSLHDLTPTEFAAKIPPWGFPVDQPIPPLAVPSTNPQHQLMQQRISFYTPALGAKSLIMILLLDFFP